MSDDDKIILKDLEDALAQKIGQSSAEDFFSLDPLHNDPLFSQIVREDYNEVKGMWKLDIHKDNREYIYPQSMHGHAMMGHGKFKQHRMRYINSSIGDLVKALGWDFETFAGGRQQDCNNFKGFIDAILEGQKPGFIVDGKPLFGVNFLPKFNDYHEVSLLKGVVAGGFMDGDKPRERTVNHYKTTLRGNELKIGSGKSYLINKIQLKKSLNTALDLSKIAHSDEDLQELRDLGILVDNPGPNIEGTFIRRQPGLGTSDDLAFMMMGKWYGKEDREHGVSAMLGGFLIDAVDTYDKCVAIPETNGIDENIAQYIQDRWTEMHGHPLISDEEIMRIIYFSAKNNDPKLNLSSSHRRLVEFAPRLDGSTATQTTIESHIDFLRGKHNKKFYMGFNFISSDEVYNVARSRAKSMLKMG